MNQSPIHPFRKLCFALTAALTTATVVAFCLQAQGQDPAEPKPAPTQEAEDCQPGDAERPAAALGFNPNRCGDLGCHSTPIVTIPLDKRPKLLPMCALDELTNWKRDRHHQAYTILLTERAQRMGTLLGIDGRVEKATECLACHSGIGVQESSEHFTVNEGVGCAVCHGARRDWVELHKATFRDEPIAGELQSWRELFKNNRGHLEEKYGLNDVWTLTKRAKLCASCHIGDSGDEKNPRKVVTHAMYAAGHPVLPGVEFATFANSMPRHWQTFNEKVAAAAPPAGAQVDPSVYFVTTKQHARFEQTRFLLVSAMVGLAESARLLENEAKASGEGPNEVPLGTSGASANQDEAKSSKDWPLGQYAQFECTACHHELKTPIPHSPGVVSGKLGRPQPVARVTPLVKLGAALLHVDITGKNNPAFSLEDACNKQIFGKRSDVITFAGALADWADKRAAELQAVDITESKVKVALRYLVDALGPEMATDYDSARQIVWAYQLIHNELHINDPRGNAVDVEGKIKSVRVGFPAHIGYEYGANLNEPQDKIAEKDLKKRVEDDLRFRENYDPAVFLKELRTLPLPPAPRPPATGGAKK